MKAVGTINKQRTRFCMAYKQMTRFDMTYKFVIAIHIYNSKITPIWVKKKN